MKTRVLPLTIFCIYFIITRCNSTNPPDDNTGNGQDTTSHLINWLVKDLGEYGSILRDVAIINDTLAYAVGEIHRNDTLFNVAKWDGTDWELMTLEYNCRLYFPNCGPDTLLYAPATSIFALGPNNIWISAGSVHHFNGTQWTQEAGILGAGNAFRIWGVNSEFWFVGYNGFIAYRSTNGQWSSMGSGTDVNLRDVWGSSDGSIIWVAGFEDSYGTVFLRNTGNGFEKVLEITDPNMPHPPNQITQVFKSLWTDKADTVYLGAIGRVYAAPKNTTGYAKENTWWDYENETEFPPETNIIRGKSGNDIFVGGYLQFIRHWNGASWKGYPEIEGDGTWRGMDIKNDLIITVGENFSAGNARIARGYRIK